MNRVREARKAKGLTIKQIAEEMQLPPFVYLYYEYHIEEMRYGLFKELCFLLDLNYLNI